MPRRPRRGFRLRSLALAGCVALVAGATTGAAVARPALLGTGAVSAEAVGRAGAEELADAGAGTTTDPGAGSARRVGEDPSAQGAADPQVQGGGRSAPPEPAPTTPPEPSPTATPTLPPGLDEEDVAAGLLSADVPAAAGGTLLVVPGSTAPGADGVPVRTVRVEVEEGLAVDGAVFAARVMEILNDPRGWGADGSTTFARTDGEADLRVVLASPAKVDAMCAPLRTRGLYSCGRYGHAALNHTRWVQGTDEFTDLGQYRDYLVNHEVGHLLGNPHVGCPAAGALAPVMQQQTIQVAPCTPNGWPFPDR